MGARWMGHLGGLASAAMVGAVVLRELVVCCSGSETTGGAGGAGGSGGRSSSSGGPWSSSTSSSGYSACELGCGTPDCGSCHCERQTDRSACTECAYEDYTACASSTNVALEYPDYDAFTSCMGACSNQFLCPPKSPCAAACEDAYPEMAALIRNNMQCAFCDTCGTTCSLITEPCYLYYCVAGPGGGDPPA